eukprot:CAMPEP_0175979270 /NCGR_PEP_ID=MMETSP0108-20121206/46133_1 /TAXON_ID=195067 ORGANISM="Goniomonas pacifica, Strain CCMP1869" /NCGR_SAMPLE_ID=MMETSP0108 /ASSEMBLY_ACC=CAM_ASM_000204 /LENGTH=61 /DNA_ID=CAMNT_0017309563 /DNA_START=12 /DNA_END=193 /DNA_ORIENTATION=+
MEGHTAAVSCVAMTEDESRFASASYDNTAKIWDGCTGVLLHTLEGHRGNVFSIVACSLARR